MKTSLVKFTLATFAVLGTLAFAQSPNEPTPATPPASHHMVDPQKQVSRLAKKLALTADQQNQILPILTDRQQQVSTIMNDSTLSQADRHAKLKTVRSDSETKLRSVLTDTQRTAYDQMQQEARERAQTRRQGTVQ